MASPFRTLLRHRVEKDPQAPLLFYHDFLAKLQVLVQADGTLQAFGLATTGGRVEVKHRTLKLRAEGKDLVPKSALVSSDCRHLALVSEGRVFVECPAKAITDASDQVVFFPLGAKEVSVDTESVGFHPTDSAIVGVLTVNGLLRLFNLALNVDRAFHSVNLKAHAIGHVRAFAFVEAAGGRLTTVEDLSMVFLNSSAVVHARFPLLFRNEKAPKSLLDGLAQQVGRLSVVDFAAAAEVEAIRASLARHNGSNMAESGTGAVQYNRDAPVRAKQVCRLDDVDPIAEIRAFQCLHNPQVGVFLVYAGLWQTSLWFSVTLLPFDGLALTLARDRPLILKSLEIDVPGPKETTVRLHNDTLLVATHCEVVQIAFGFLKRVSARSRGAGTVAEELDWHLARCVTRVPRPSDFELVDAFPGLSEAALRVFGYNEAEKCVYFASCDIERPTRVPIPTETAEPASAEPLVVEGLRLSAMPPFHLTLKRKRLDLQLKAAGETLRRLDAQGASLGALGAVLDSGPADPTFCDDVASVKHVISAVGAELAVQAVRQNELSVALSRFSDQSAPKLEVLAQKRTRIAAKVDQLRQRFQALRVSFAGACQEYLDGSEERECGDGSAEFIADRIAPRLEDLKDRIAYVT